MLQDRTNQLPSSAPPLSYRKLNGGDNAVPSGIHFVNIQMGDDNSTDESENDAHNRQDDDSTIVTTTTYNIDVDDDDDDDSNNNLNNAPFFQRNEIIETKHGNSVAIPSSLFLIPTLPFGQTLKINILSTWGDPYYVGLMGIDLFDGNGHPIFVDKITADPPDINILPEYEMDPRTISNLIDGVNHTCDDLHAWLVIFLAVEISVRVFLPGRSTRIIV